MVINANLWALSDSPHSISLTSACRITLIDYTIVIYFNYRKDSYFALFCLEPKDISNIKEIEKKEKEISNKLKKEKL